jgi:hypothetical protein
MSDIMVIPQQDVMVAPSQRELSINEVKAQVMKVQHLMKDLMQEGTHYGNSFPGDTKKNLLKPGADKLCFMFRLRPDFSQEINRLPGDHMEVLTRCSIFHMESGQKVADGIGMASTMESKYRWRNGALKCPVCGQETIIKGKEEYGGGWVCYAKKGGCGEKFPDGSKEIEDQPRGKIENSDIADTYNTVIKMSKKRAYVDATITSCAASDIFTQDLEDLEKDSTNAAPHKKSPMGEQTPQKNYTPPTNDKNIALRKELGEKLVAIMIAQSPDALDYFTEEEKKSVKTLLAKTGAHLQGISIVEGMIQKWQEKLETRKAEYVPVEFDEPSQEDSLPSMYQEPEREDDFIDDKPEPLTQKLARQASQEEIF